MPPSSTSETCAHPNVVIDAWGERLCGCEVAAAIAYRFRLTVASLTATLIEIEDRGTRLIGCLDCNDWRSIDGLRRVKLADDDVGALRKLCGERTVESP